jgi:tetratricopeptide (TPR) repeat protein
VSEKFQVAKLSETELPDSSTPRSWWGIRNHFGIGSFGINAWTAPDAGMDVINDHDETGTGHEELYLVLDGRATFTVDGETVDGPAGTAVFVRDPEARRQAIASEAGTTVLAVGARPGEVFQPSNWERSAPALAYFATKEYDKAHELLMRVHEENPTDATVLYNLACVESLLGRTPEALEHLEQSLANGPERLRELARTDADFDPIREEPGFKELFG